MKYLSPVGIMFNSSGLTASLMTESWFLVGVNIVCLVMHFLAIRSEV